MGKKETVSIGFLTVLEHRQFGLFGGYLVVNRAGRPLEFHCTAPVRPNRTQQILYGPTLGPFLIGEQIGRALIEKSPSRPLCVLTDRRAALSLADVTELPVGLVLPPEIGQGESAVKEEISRPRGDLFGAEHQQRPSIEQLSEETEGSESIFGNRDRDYRLDSAHTIDALRLTTLAIGGSQLAVPEAAQSRWRDIQLRFEAEQVRLDLAEPFSRVREAIEEAGKSFQRN